jgi:hypothetical protein
MAIRLFENSKITLAFNSTDGALGTGTINGGILDMQLWDSCLVIVTFAAINTGATTTIKLQQDTDSAMGAAADLTGTSQSVADTDDGKAFYIDIHRPLERYIRCVVGRASGSSVCSCLYIQYNGKSHPSTHGSGVSGENFESPAEGTA